MPQYLTRTEQLISRITQGLGYLAATLLVLLLINVFYDVVMRYLLNDVSIAMQELEWHLFATVFLPGPGLAVLCCGDYIWHRVCV